MRIPHEARVAPLFDVAGAATHFHRIAGHAARIAAGAELDQRRQDAHALGGLLVAGIGQRQQLRDLHEHRARLLRRQQHLQELALHQRHVDQLAAKGFAIARDVQRLGGRAAHQASGAHAVRQPRHVDHVGHLVEAAADLADQVGGGAFEHDLPAGHGAGAELVFQADDPVVVACAIRQRLGQQEQGQAVDTRRRTVRTGQHHGKVGVGVGAEPLVAVQAPGLCAVGCGL